MWDSEREQGLLSGNPDFGTTRVRSRRWTFVSSLMKIVMQVGKDWHKYLLQNSMNLDSCIVTFGLQKLCHGTRQMHKVQMEIPSL